MKKNHPLPVCIIMFLALIALYGIWVEPNQLTVTHIHIQSEGINSLLKDKTAIHLSDLHIKKIGGREKKLLFLIEKLSPDFIFLTGDYITWKGHNKAALSFLAKLKAQIGTWAVMGDYDYSNSMQSCYFCHKKNSGDKTTAHQINFLKNSVSKISLPDGDIAIAGIDHEDNGPFIQQLSQSKRSIPLIILAHNPMLFDRINAQEPLLILSGDTHGGQIPLPDFLWNIVGYKKCARYKHGLFKKNSKTMYVSRGIGTSHFPIRILTPPELVVLHF